jgi:hypothetical protein
VYSCALTHDFCQNGFARLVNECHVDQLDDAPAGVAFVALFSPSQPQLSRPLTDQLTLQRPPLLIKQIGYIDPQQHSPSTSRQKPATLKAHHISTDRRACVRQLHVALGFSEGIQRFRGSGFTRCRCLICFL